MTDEVNHPDDLPVIFVIGLSGVGKSTAGKYVEADLNFLHLEQDRPEGDGIDILGLRKEWDAYLYENKPEILAKRLREMAIDAGKEGTILTFYSTVELSPDEIKRAEVGRINTVLLDGPAADCLNAYLKRDKDIAGRNERRWHEHNDRANGKFSTPAYDEYRVRAFENHKRKSRSEIVAAIRQKAGIA